MTVLVLAGTREARLLCRTLAADGIDAIASLAGVTETPEEFDVPVRTGGFGGAEGLYRWLTAHRISAVLDATHPFAAKMPWNAAAAATELSLPRMRLLRDNWPIEPAWQTFDGILGAADALPRGAHVMLTTGRNDFSAFADRHDVRFVLRSIEHPGELPDHIQSMIARPPFSLEQELATFQLLGITHLVSKNAGGSGRAKLDAARQLGVSICMINRPRQPAGTTVASVDEAVAWVRQTVDNGPLPIKPDRPA